MSTLGIGFTLTANAAELASGVNEAIEQFGSLNDAASATSGYFDALQNVDLTGLAMDALTGNWAGVAEEAFKFVDAIGGVQRVLQDVQAVAYGAADAVYELEQRAIAAGVSFQDMQIQSLLDAGAAADDIQRLGLALSEVNADRFYELAEASNAVEESQSRMGQAGQALIQTLVTPFTGLFESFDYGAAAMQNGLADILGGITALADPIASVLSPFLDIIGLLGESVARVAGLFLEVTGVVLRLAGAIIKVPLELFAESWRRIADLIQTAVRGAFDYIGGGIDYIQNKINDFYNFMSDVPLIGDAFASGKGGVPEAGKVGAAASAATPKPSQEAQKVAQEQKRAEEWRQKQEQQQADWHERERVRNAERMRQESVRKQQQQQREQAAAFARQQREAAKQASDVNKKREQTSKQIASVDEKIEAKKKEGRDFLAERKAALGGKSNEALKANDVRSSEGMSQFLALATGREDPAIAEYRKQTQKLDEIRGELRALQTEKVTILNGAGA
jgi:DNA segregation ATPase FtsK/SpoIIIE-like protein